ncbi:hypothetical protein ACIO3O_41960 [Streptomyces sp. NPDC087440]|uniref:hypothetical protein n=1 Tax=Streptomyces sp. NPDC087440 TaxID=3365790 RepID=UPI00382083A2
MFQRGPDRLKDQLQAGQLASGGQDVGGVGALFAPLLDQSGRRKPCHGQVEQLVGAILLGEPVAEVAQHTVVETGMGPARFE